MTKEQLFDFLEKEGALEKFIANVKNDEDYKKVGEEKYYEKILAFSKMFCCSPIQVAFIWNNVPEPNEYWSKLADKIY